VVGFSAGLWIEARVRFSDRTISVFLCEEGSLRGGTRRKSVLRRAGTATERALLS
jgi:hypothetical protein